MRRAEVVAAALSWVGTPYHHLQACRGAGVDCVGLVVGIARELGVFAPAWSPGYYSPEWHLHQSQEMLLGRIDAAGWPIVAADYRQPGDVLVFRLAPQQPCSHLGILVDRGELVHAVGTGPRRVIRQRLTGRRLRQLARCYLFPGVTA